MNYLYSKITNFIVIFPEIQYQICLIQLKKKDVSSHFLSLTHNSTALRKWFISIKESATITLDSSLNPSVWLLSLKYFLNRTVRYRHLRLKCIKSALESAGTKRSRNWTYYFDWTVSVSNYSKKDSSDHDSQVYHVSILDVAVAAASLVVAYCLQWLWVFQIWRIVWFP